jgi:hypothetical protein
MTEKVLTAGENAVPLLRPLIDQDGNEHTSLTLKEPTGAAYVRIGDPFNVVMVDGGKSQAIDQNRERLLSYVAEVTGIHRPILLTMHFKDILNVTDEMFRFFG